MTQVKDPTTSSQRLRIGLSSKRHGLNHLGTASILSTMVRMGVECLRRPRDAPTLTSFQSPSILLYSEVKALSPSGTPSRRQTSEEANEYFIQSWAAWTYAEQATRVSEV